MLQKYVFNYAGGKGLAFQFRQKRAERVKKIIRELKTDDAPVRILDMGGTETYWKAVGYDWLSENNVEITLLNLTVKITEISSEFAHIFKSIAGDACKLDFPDNEFDLCFSNSVVEHVGDFSRMHSFASEARRVAHSYYCQTPNFWFPIEPHFLFFGFHYLPEPVRVRLLQRFKLGHYAREPDLIEAYRIIQSAQLIDYKAMRALFPDADIEKERFLYIFTKSLTASKSSKSNAT